MPYLQELIHKVEEGPWFRHLRIGLAVLAVVVVIGRPVLEPPAPPPGEPTMR